MKAKKITTVLPGLLLALISYSQPAYNESIVEYQSNYKKDLADIIQSDTGLVQFYPIDPEYRVIAKVEKLYGQKFFNLPTSDGKSKQAIRYATVKFTLAAKEYTMYAYQLSSLLNSEEYKNNFFIPFTDASSGKTSNGGGKYIDFVTSDILPNGTLVLDFNKSYNPYCAFRAEYSCPIPPAENDLPVEIKAGEMAFVKK